MSTNTPSWVMTYNSLNSIVLQYLERSDQATINAIPTFITLAEFEIAQEIKTLGQLQIVESSTIAGNPVLAKPSRWRKTVSMNYTNSAGVRTPILLRKYEYLTNFWPNNTNTAAPVYYADTNSTPKFGQSNQLADPKCTNSNVVWHFVASHAFPEKRPTSDFSTKVHRGYSVPKD